MSKLIQIASWSAAPQANVVFVHGLMGDAYATWRRGSEDPASDPTFWPLWLSKDAPGLNIFTLSYDAPVSNWLGTTMALPDRAANILEVLLAQRELRARPTYFICHSLGGLVVKQVLLSLKEQEGRSGDARMLLDQIKKVVFIATPHTGARKAALLGKLGFLMWPSAIARSLVANDPGLRKVNISYRGLADDRRSILAHKIFYETQETMFGGIVDEAAADPGLHANPIPIDANHVTIAKPRSRDELLYILVLEFIQKDVKTSIAGERVEKALPPVDVERSWNLAPKLVRLAILATVCGFSYYYSVIHSRFVRPEADPKAVAQSYLAEFDRKDYEVAFAFWDAAAKAGLGGIDRYIEIVKSNLEPLGPLQSRQFTGANEAVSPAGAQRGLYFTATFKSKFGTDCRIEGVTLRSNNDNKWQVYGHQLSPQPIPC